MELGRLKFSFLFFYIIFVLSVGKKLTGKLTFPFSEFTINHKDLNASNLKFTCKDQILSMKECVEQCYFRETTGLSCLGFIINKHTKECNICFPATVPEIIKSNNKQINENHVVYVLKYKKKKPVMYLPLEGDNITGTTVIGDGVNGTLISKENTQVQAGKVNQGLHVKNGERLVLHNTANKCLGNLSICTDGLSIALWINPSSLASYTRHITFSEYSINIVAISSGVIGAWTSGQPNTMRDLTTQSVAQQELGLMSLSSLILTLECLYTWMGYWTRLNPLKRLVHTQVPTILMTICLVVREQDIILLMKQWMKLKFSAIA